MIEATLSADVPQAVRLGAEVAKRLISRGAVESSKAPAKQRFEISGHTFLFDHKPIPLMQTAKYTADDFHHSPLMFYYEVTQACDLVCKHCRASAQSTADPTELATEQSKKLIDQVATFPHRPTMVMTGGDPLKRLDLFDLIRHAVSAGLQVALTPSATPLATREAFQRAKEAGVQALGISLDGVDAATHDAFRGWTGSFDRTLRMLDDARDLGLPVQVNTTITRRNFAQIDAIAEMLSGRGIAMWSAFFLIPVGRGVEEERIAPEEYEVAFERLWRHARQQPYAVKTTEAPHYRRYVLQHGGDPLAGPRVRGCASFAAGAVLRAGVRSEQLACRLGSIAPARASGCTALRWG